MNYSLLVGLFPTPFFTTGLPSKAYFKNISTIPRLVSAIFLLKRMGFFYPLFGYKKSFYSPQILFFSPGIPPSQDFLLILSDALPPLFLLRRWIILKK